MPSVQDDVGETVLASTSYQEPDPLTLALQAVTTATTTITTITRNDTGNYLQSINQNRKMKSILGKKALGNLKQETNVQIDSVLYPESTIQSATVPDTSWILEDLNSIKMEAPSDVEVTNDAGVSLERGVTNDAGVSLERGAPLQEESVHLVMGDSEGEEVDVDIEDDDDCPLLLSGTTLSPDAVYNKLLSDANVRHRRGRPGKTASERPVSVSTPGDTNENSSDSTSSKVLFSDLWAEAAVVVSQKTLQSEDSSSVECRNSQLARNQESNESEDKQNILDLDKGIEVKNDLCNTDVLQPDGSAVKVTVKEIHEPSSEITSPEAANMYSEMTDEVDEATTSKENESDFVIGRK